MVAFRIRMGAAAKLYMYPSTGALAPGASVKIVVSSPGEPTAGSVLQAGAGPQPTAHGIMVQAVVLGEGSTDAATAFVSGTRLWRRKLKCVITPSNGSASATPAGDAVHGSSPGMPAGSCLSPQIGSPSTRVGPTTPLHLPRINPDAGISSARSDRSTSKALLRVGSASRKADPLPASSAAVSYASYATYQSGEDMDIVGGGVDALLAQLVQPSGCTTEPGFGLLLGKQLGYGMSSRVHVAIRASNGETVAVKRVAVSSPHILQLVVRELQVLQTLPSHPCIVNYLGCGITPASTAQPLPEVDLIIEHVPGGSLADLVKQHGALPLPLAAKYIWHLLQAVEWLHRHGVAHRDIKGANVLLHSDGSVKLADFGSALFLQGSAFGAGVAAGGTPPFALETPRAAGTVAWMAPEVVSNSVASRAAWLAADIWSVGCTMVELLTGHALWGSGTAPATAMMRIVSTSPMDALAGELPEPAVSLVSACFAAQPDQRPTAAQLMQHAVLQATRVLAAPLRVPSQVSAPALQPATTAAPSELAYALAAMFHADCERARIARAMDLLSVSTEVGLQSARSARASHSARSTEEQQSATGALLTARSTAMARGMLRDREIRRISLVARRYFDYTAHTLEFSLWLLTGVWPEWGDESDALMLAVQAGASGERLMQGVDMAGSSMLANMLDLARTTMRSSDAQKAQAGIVACATQVSWNWMHEAAIVPEPVMPIADVPPEDAHAEEDSGSVSSIDSELPGRPEPPACSWLVHGGLMLRWLELARMKLFHTRTVSSKVSCGPGAAQATGPATGTPKAAGLSGRALFQPSAPRGGAAQPDAATVPEEMPVCKLDCVFAMWRHLSAHVAALQDVLIALQVVLLCVSALTKHAEALPHGTARETRRHVSNALIAVSCRGILLHNHVMHILNGSWGAGFLEAALPAAVEGHTGEPSAQGGELGLGSGGPEQPSEADEDGPLAAGIAAELSTFDELVVMVLADYTAASENELNLQEGDLIVVMHQDDSGWWEGECNGEIGWFPSNHVAVQHTLFPIVEEGDEEADSDSDA